MSDKPGGWPTDDDFTAALRVRSDVIGQEYVTRATADSSAANVAYQRLVTETAWGQWTDPRLGRRERSMITLAMLAAAGRMDEFELHTRGAVRNGVTVDELEALVLHVGAYAGVPAAVAARRHLHRALADGR